MELVRQFPLRPVRSKKGLDDATKMIDGLLDKVRLTTAEKDYLDVLTTQPYLAGLFSSSAAAILCSPWQSVQTTGDLAGFRST
jgi:hypothetical protein